jgi:hypothetical protein
MILRKICYVLIKKVGFESAQRGMKMMKGLSFPARSGINIQSITNYEFQITKKLKT